jgi:putative beta-lysine N-acetyltransferase
MTPEDAPAMAALYREVFKTYPFPIHDPAYLKKTMDENIIYFGIERQGALLGLSSIEMDKKNAAAEMTDFAVLPAHRGDGLAQQLLTQMERTIPALGIKTMFTIARARSAGMNITFAKNGYSYAGTLINNTNISGQIESMNVWYKRTADMGLIEDSGDWTKGRQSAIMAIKGH